MDAQNAHDLVKLDSILADSLDDQSSPVSFVARAYQFWGKKAVMKHFEVFLLLNANDVAQEVARGIDNTNGITLPQDEKTLYVGESGADRVLGYQIAGNGALHNPWIFAGLNSLTPHPSAGRYTPDGLRLGPDRLMYAALFNGGGYWVLDKKSACKRIRGAR